MDTSVYTLIKMNTVENKREISVCNQVIMDRSDKKYCSDQCRATANNKLKNNTEKLIIEYNKKLRRNRTILKTLCPVGKSTVRKSVLTDMGFDFSAIIQKGIEKALIITRQPYIAEYEWQPWK